MAILQKTLISGSIFVGSGSSASYDSYSTGSGEFYISSPKYSGSGFIFEGLQIAGADVGGITNGQDLSNASIKLIIDSMLFYSAPSFKTLRPLGTSTTGYSYYLIGSSYGINGTIDGFTASYNNDSNVLLQLEIWQNTTGVTTELLGESLTKDTCPITTSAVTRLYTLKFTAISKNTKGVEILRSFYMYNKYPIYTFYSDSQSLLPSEFTLIVNNLSTYNGNKIFNYSGVSNVTKDKLFDISGCNISGQYFWLCYPETSYNVKYYYKPDNLLNWSTIQNLWLNPGGSYAQYGVTLNTVTLPYTSSVNVNVTKLYRGFRTGIVGLIPDVNKLKIGDVVD